MYLYCHSKIVDKRVTLHWISGRSLPMQNFAEYPSCLICCHNLAINQNTRKTNYANDPRFNIIATNGIPGMLPEILLPSVYFRAKYIFDFLSLHTWQDIACNCWHISLLCSVQVANPRGKWGDFSCLISDLDLCSQGVNEIQKENIS